jgi:hypothetical protein
MKNLEEMQMNLSNSTNVILFLGQKITEYRLREEEALKNLIMC